MTEDEWLNLTKATQPVLDWLRRKGSDRQFYLAAVAAVRQVWDLLPDDRYRELIVLVERYADGLVSSVELGRAQRAAEHDAQNRYLALVQRGLRPRQAVRQATAAAAAAHSAMPGAAFQSACNAFFETAQTGKRAAFWPWQCAILKDVFGNPFRKVAIDPRWLQWNDATVPRIAQAIYDERRFQDLPILADALMDAGCHSEAVLNHCRQPAEHVRGCWVVDRLLNLN